MSGKYALDVISEVGLLGAKPANVPLESNHKLALVEGRPLTKLERYLRLIGHLRYLCFTRPDLSSCVYILSQFMHLSREEHREAALRVFRFLKGRSAQGILLRVHVI